MVFISKFRPRCFFRNLAGHFESDCPQFWVPVADSKHPRHEEALSGVKASKAHLMSEAKARRKEKPQEYATKGAAVEKKKHPERNRRPQHQILPRTLQYMALESLAKSASEWTFLKKTHSKNEEALALHTLANRNMLLAASLRISVTSRTFRIRTLLTKSAL